MPKRRRTRFDPSRLAGKISPEKLSRILHAAEGARIRFILEERGRTGWLHIPLDADDATQFLLDPDGFWMHYYRLDPERYQAWRRHIERAGEFDSQVQCLGVTKNGSQCRREIDVHWDGSTFDPVLHDYCALHRKR